MSWVRGAIFAVLTNAVCLGTTQPPFAAERGIIDRAFEKTAISGPLGSVALEILRQLALGQSAEISGEAEVTVGFAPAHSEEVRSAQPRFGLTRSAKLERLVRPRLSDF